MEHIKFQFDVGYSNNAEIKLVESHISGITGLTIDIIVDDDTLDNIGGPLRGIFSALDICRDDVFIYAVDYPFIRGLVVDQLLQVHQEKHSDMTVIGSLQGTIHNLLMVTHKNFLMDRQKIFTGLSSSRVSNLIRSASSVTILEMKSQTDDFVNMNHYFSISPTYGPMEYQVSVIKTSNHFIQFLDEVNKGEVSEELVSFLDAEKLIWKGYSVQYHIQKYIEQYQRRE